MPFSDRLSVLRGRRACLAAAGLGAVSAAALPPLYLGPVLLLTVPALLLLIGGQTRMREAAWIGFWFGFGHHVCGLYWITEPILIEAAHFWWLVPLAAPLLAAALAPFIALPCALAWRAAPGLPRVLTFAGAWVVADLARQFVLTGFPWNPWGSVWEVPGRVGDVMIQPAAFVGVHGLTLATVLLACTPSLGRRAMAMGAAALVVWAGFGVWRTSASPAAPDLTVVLVQGNVPEGGVRDAASAMAIFDRYLKLTRDALDALRGRPAVVVWPESASPYLLQTDANARAAVASVAAGTPVLAGTVRFDSAHRPRNSLVAVTGPGPLAAIYDKSHLVPFGEYQPDWTPIPLEIIPGGGFDKGSGPETFHVPGLPAFGALICYEAIFPAQIVDPASRPDWLVNITNDAWFGNSSGPRQHLAAVRMRAVEEGLPLMRAANTGISAAFDALGHEQGRIGMGLTRTLSVPLAGALPAPPFARFGLVIPGILSVATLGAGLLRKRMPAAASSLS